MGDGLNNKENRKKAKDKSVKSPSKSSSQVWFSDQEFRVRQNLPPDLPRRPTDVFLLAELVEEQQARIIKLLEEDNKVWLHSLGSNIPAALNIVNTARQKFGSDKLLSSCWSYTWEALTDSWEQCDGGIISGVHISLTRLATTAGSQDQ